MSEITLVSAFQVGEIVNVDFMNSKQLRHCKVAAVKFTDYGKVLYDIQVPVGFKDQVTVIKSVDSGLIVRPMDPMEPTLIP